MYILILDQWNNKVDYRYIDSEQDDIAEIVQGFAKINNFTTKFCEIEPELLTRSRQLNIYEEEMKKISMKKVEASKADKAADKNHKEGSKADIAQDKKLQTKMSKKK